MIYSGIACGGPLSGVKLKCPSEWPGLVQRDLTGRYMWDVKTESWRWVSRAKALGPTVKKPGRKPKNVTSSRS